MKSAGPRVVEDLPKPLTREREAAIRQFMDTLTLETAQTRQLVVQLRGALEAGTETSQSLTTSIRAFDQLMGRFDKTRAGGTPSRAPGDHSISPNTRQRRLKLRAQPMNWKASSGASIWRGRRWHRPSSMFQSLCGMRSTVCSGEHWN
jgi:hypothetical protein